LLSLGKQAKERSKKRLGKKPLMVGNYRLMRWVWPIGKKGVVGGGDNKTGGKKGVKGVKQQTKPAKIN